VIAKRAPEIFEAIPEARQIVDFRNLLTHEYIKVSDSDVTPFIGPGAMRVGGYAAVS
jgi:uncharacterized protein with HEPN domain